MNNEPVAFVTGANKFDPVMVDTVLKVGTPLYTHSVKELTDEEITEIAKDCGYANAYHYNIRFAKAILRKAQDK